MKKKASFKKCLLIIICITIVIVAWATGVRAFVVLSGSMEPAVKTGSVIVDIKADASKLKPGDIITFKKDSNLVATHRIAEVKLEGFVTKGDANNSVDREIVKPEDLIGKVLFSVPLLGYLFSFIKTRYGIICCLVIILLLVVLSMLTKKGEQG